MTKQNKYRNKKASDFFDYTEGKLTDKERNAFERRMQKDPFESDAAEGFSRVSREEAAQDLQSVAGGIRKRIEGESSRNRIGSKSSRSSDNESQTGGGRGISGNRNSDRKQRIGRSRRIAWYSAAAAFASLMIVATVFFRFNDNGLERFVTAPEMREAAKEQTTPLQKSEVDRETEMNQETVIELDKPVGKENGEKEPGDTKVKAKEEPVSSGIIDKQEPVGTKVNKKQILLGTEVNEKQEPVSVKVVGHKEPLGKEVNVQKELTGEGVKEQGPPKRKIVGKSEKKIAKTAFTVTAGPDAKKAYNLKEIQETQADVDHAFAWEKKKEAEAGRDSSTQQRMVTTEAPADQPTATALVTDEVSPDEIMVIAVPEKGIADYRNYIDSTLVYPELSEPSGRKVVVLKFSISPDGQPQNFRVMRAPGNKLFEKEAIRVVSEGPPWQPATSKGNYIEKEVRLRIVFR